MHAWMTDWHAHNYYFFFFNFLQSDNRKIWILFSKEILIRIEYRCTVPRVLHPEFAACRKRAYADGIPPNSMISFLLLSNVVTPKRFLLTYHQDLPRYWRHTSFIVYAFSAAFVASRAQTRAGLALILAGLQRKRAAY